MRTLILLFAAGVLLCPAQLPEVEILDESFADYLEDEQTNRILAGIQVKLRRTGGETRLQITASAESPNVDPVPGYRGLRGANHITARELGKLLTSGELEVVTQHAASDIKHFGACWPGRRGRIPERRIDEHGELLLRVPSKHECLLEVHGRSVVLPEGEHDTYLEVKGVPRLRVRTRLAKHTGEILSVESLGGHDLRE